MKMYAIAVLTALFLFSGMSAPGATVTSTQSGNWSATTTWGGNPAPVAGDVVIIDGGFCFVLARSPATASEPHTTGLCHSA